MASRYLLLIFVRPQTVRLDFYVTTTESRVTTSKAKQISKNITAKKTVLKVLREHGYSNLASEIKLILFI